MARTYALFTRTSNFPPSNSMRMPLNRVIVFASVTSNSYCSMPRSESPDMLDICLAVAMTRYPVERSRWFKCTSDIGYDFLPCAWNSSASAYPMLPALQLIYHRCQYYIVSYCTIAQMSSKPDPVMSTLRCEFAIFYNLLAWRSCTSSLEELEDHPVASMLICSDNQVYKVLERELSTVMM